MMNAKILIASFMVLVVLIAGCTEAPAAGTPAIKTQEEAKQTVSNVSKDIEGVSATLKEIDEALK